MDSKPGIKPRSSQDRQAKDGYTRPELTYRSPRLVKQGKIFAILGSLGSSVI